MRETLKRHWPEYLIEATGLGLLLLFACTIKVVLNHPDSQVSQALPHPVIRRAITGVLIGIAAICLIYSPWGKRSGAHFNPATTFTFYRLGKIAPQDAFFYILAQFAGGTLGVLLSVLILGVRIAHPTISYNVTLPGIAGVFGAFIAEVAITFLLMSVILLVSNTPRIARYTGLCTAGLAMLYITFEAPLSGMSMNPARSFATAFAANNGMALWLYFIAPPLGMLLAAEGYRRMGGRIACAKLHHENPYRCIFCDYHRHKPGKFPNQ